MKQRKALIPIIAMCICLAAGCSGNTACQNTNTHIKYLPPARFNSAQGHCVYPLNSLFLEIIHKANKKTAAPFTMQQPLLFCLSDCYIFAFGKLFLRLLLRYLQFQDTVLEFSLDILLRYGITDIEAP